MTLDSLKEDYQRMSSRVDTRGIYIDPLDDVPACYVDVVGIDSIHIKDTAVNPTGKYFLAIFGETLSFNKGIKVWSLNTGKEVFSLSHLEGYQQFYFAEQDQLLLITTSEIQLIDLNSPSPAAISLAKSDVISSTVSEDGSRIGVFSHDGHLRVYSITTQKLLFDRLVNRTIRSEEFNFSATGKELLFYTIDGLTLANIENGSMMRLKPRPRSETATEPPLKNGDLPTIAPCTERDGYGKQMIVVNLQEGSFSALGSGECLIGMAYSPISKLVAEVSYAALKVWDIEGRQIGKTLQMTTAPTSIAFDSDGKQLVGFPEDGPVKIWDALRVEEKPPTDDVNLALTMGRGTNGLVRIKQKWFRLSTRYGRTYTNCLLFEESSSQSPVMQLCILNEAQGFPWVIAARPNRFDTSESGYVSVRPGFTDIRIVQSATKRRYYEPGLLVNVLTKGAVPNTQPFLKRISDNHLRGQHGSFLDFLLNAGFAIGMLVLSFTAAMAFLSLGLQPALWRSIYCLPLHTRLLQLRMIGSMIPLIKDLTLIGLGILLCFSILIFMDRVVGLSLVTLFFASICLISSFNERYTLFALPVKQRHSLLGSVLPHLNNRDDITLVRMLVSPNSLLWTRPHTILVMAGLSVQKLFTFGFFMYAGIYANSSKLFWFGSVTSLWFYKHSNKEARAILPNSKGILIEQRILRVFGDTIAKAFEAIRRLVLFIARPTQAGRLKSLMFAVCLLLLRLVDTVLLGTLLFLILYFPAVWLRIISG